MSVGILLAVKEIQGFLTWTWTYLSWTWIFFIMDFFIINII